LIAGSGEKQSFPTFRTSFRAFARRQIWNIAQLNPICSPAFIIKREATNKMSISDCESDPAVKPKRTRVPDLKIALAVRPKIAWNMLDCGNTRGYELIAAKELDSFLDGRSRKITVDSIRQYIARRLAATDNSKNVQRRRGRPRKAPNDTGAHAS
jgi:hypothetical protein